MKKLLLIIAILFISKPVIADQQEFLDKTTDHKKIGWMQRGMDAAKTILKDPESAKFRNVYFNQGADNIPMTCGEVNSKNSFGGYGGFQRFISGGKPELSFLEEQVGEDFTTIWERFCQ